MTQWGQALLWCSVQVSVICLVALVLARFVGRRNPAAGVWSLRLGLLAAVVATLAAPVPLPGWFAAQVQPLTASVDSEVPAGADNPRTESSGLVPEAASGTPSGTNTPNGKTSAGQVAGLIAGLREFFSQAIEPSVSADSRHAEQAETQAADKAAPGSSVISMVVFGGGVLGLCWLAAGVTSVRLLLRRSEPLTDERPRELLDLVSAEMCVRRSIALREAELGSAATVGFFRPIILLPSAWYDWSDEELRAVLAHEVAHVRAGDYGATFLGQIVLAVHFFHPFVHWLTRQLRLAQELAADARASVSVSDRTRYATVLAGMALREDKQTTNLWATQAFLPAPRTLLRRIEMLRDATQLRTTISRPARIATTSALLCTLLLVLGLRANQPTELRGLGSENDSPPDAPLLQESPLSLDWVPNGSLFVFGFRPAAFLDHQELSEAAAQVRAFLKAAGLDPDDLASVLACGTNPRKPNEGVIILRSRKPTDWKSLAETIAYTRETKIHDQIVQANQSVAWFAPDDRTFIRGDRESIAEVIRAGRRGTTNRFWHAQWKTVAGKPAAFLFDIGALRDVAPRNGTLLGQQANHGPAALLGPTLFEATAPIWDKSELFAASITLGEELGFEGRLTTVGEGEARAVAETAGAGMVLLKNALMRQQFSAARSKNPQAAVVSSLTGLAVTAVARTRVEAQGSEVAISTSSPWGEVGSSVASLVPSVQKSRMSARRMQSHNNLKQLAIAMHNYHDVHGHFPPASSMGKDGKGKHPVSWRVLLTPYVEHPEIYNNYRFDEPWNSPHNSKVTQEIPTVFAHPSTQPGAQETAYYAVVSTNARKLTCFSKNTPRRLRDIIDGTANSVMLVEAKRGTHWAQPKDIEWSPDADPPELGGFEGDGFAAVLADGAVMHFGEGLEPERLRLLLLVNDGQVARVR